MGTLFNQKARPNFESLRGDIDHFLDEIVFHADANNFTKSEVIEAIKTLEMKRTNDLFHYNGDAFDEQIAGIGYLIEKFIDLFEATI